MAAPDVTLSIRRFIQILELYERERRPLTSGQIADVLDAPKSSVGSLVRALVDMGVLIMDRRTGVYFPTIWFAELSTWIVEGWFPNGAFLARIDELRDLVGETALLSTPADLTMEILHVAQGLNPITLNLKIGQRMWMPFSAIGNAYLGTLPSATTSKLLRRMTDAAKEAGRPFDAAALQKEVRKVRQAGYAVAYDGIIAGAGGVAMALPEHCAPRPLVLSLGGPSDRIKVLQPRIASLLKDFIRDTRRYPAQPSSPSRKI